MASSIKEDLIKTTQKLSKFNGLSCQLIISFPYYFTFFVIYEGIRDRLQSSHTTNFLAALVGETVSNILKNPLELVKQQIMVGRSNKIGTLLSSVYNTLGIRGFYMGYSPALVRDVLFSAT
jgi:ABC-type siderophore export system fused ATPase/permease subunit